MKEPNVKAFIKKDSDDKQKTQQYIEAKVGQELLSLPKEGKLPPAPQNPWIS